MAEQSADDSTLSENPQRAKLREHFIDHEATKHTQRWEDLWRQGFVPWDRGLPNPALVDLVADRGELLPSPLRADGNRRRALVPGCGRGYDVLLLSSFGYDAYGLEASEGALKACRALEAEGREEYNTKSETIGKGKVTWISGNYFEDGWMQSIEGSERGFDLIYDYTVRLLKPVT